jgi:hypothetical protein
MQEMSSFFVGDQMTHSGQKGFGMTKHGRSGHATRSPRFRFLQKLEAKKNDRKDRSRIKDPKPSVEELFHPGSQHEPDELAESGLRRLLEEKQDYVRAVRDFRVGTFETCRCRLMMSVSRGGAEIVGTWPNRRELTPKLTSVLRGRDNSQLHDRRFSA